MKKSYKKRLAEEMVSRFRKEFYATFGVYPVVNYSFDKTGLPRITLKMLEQLVNDVMEEEDPEFYTPMGIRLRTRKREIVMYRQAFLKIAYDIGYGPSVSATHIGYDHATAIHGNRHMVALLETHDVLATRIYNTVINGYKKRFSDDGDVQQDSSGESDTE